MKTQNTLPLLFAFCLTACASGPQTQAPPDLLKTEWLLEDLAGKGVLDRVQATLAFPAPNKVAGNSSCNRFMGAGTIEGGSIKIGPLATTMMACRGGAAVSNQEREYLKALEGAEKISVAGPYLLIYSKGLEKPLKFTQMTPAKPK